MGGGSGVDATNPVMVGGKIKNGGSRENDGQPSRLEGRERFDKDLSYRTCDDYHGSFTESEVGATE